LGFGQMQQQGMTDPTHQIYQFQGKWINWVIN
jgi:hypothetical protein